MESRKALTLALALGMVLAILGAAAATAQTPDGETPAVEDVCDHLSGAAYGLCNAYCEAMDCHLNRPDEPGAVPPFPSASEKACLKVMDNFIKISGMPELPCEAGACPVGTEGCECTDTQTCEGDLICDMEVDPPVCSIPDDPV